MAHLVGVPSCNQSVVGLIPLRARAWAAGVIPGPGTHDPLIPRVGGNQSMLLSRISSLPSSLSKSNEKMSSGEN